jgi:hypothetical protein
VIIPNLVPAASTGSPHAFAAAAVHAARSGEETAVVGHSGAGAVLPLIATQLKSTLRQVVFVDASVPPCDGTFRAGGGFLSTLRDLAANGVLPPWSRWWGESVMEALVPDDQRRREIEQELPQVPLAFYDVSIEVPTDWCSADCAYVLLSDAYRADANRAALLGWPVIERQGGGHLDIVNDDEEIASILVDLADRR